MVCGTFKLNKVPDREVADTIAMFKANVPPPTSVTSAPDGPGTSTVTAVFPPCPAEMVHDPAGDAGGEPAGDEPGGDDRPDDEPADDEPAGDEPVDDESAGGGRG